WCSIDNDESRDLDQLSVMDVAANGSRKVLIAIADVDAAVQQGLPVDRHAAVNTTSVYTPAMIFPMLPERLSTDLSSFGEGGERRRGPVPRRTWLPVDPARRARAGAVGPASCAGGRL